MKKVNTNQFIKNKKYSKKEEDGSITTMLCLEAYGVNKLHSIEEPALVNEKQRKKEYYLNGIQYDFEMWKEIKKSGEGLPWYKQSGMKGARH